jgi:hypothetical protein
MSAVEIHDPEDAIRDWTGVVRKVWLDEMPDDDEFVEYDDPHYHGPYTVKEQHQLEEYGQSALKVNDEEYPSVLRVIYIREDLAANVEESIQVFVAVYDDGRKKDRIHYARGETKASAFEREADEGSHRSTLTNLRERDGVELQHLGSFAEYRESADEFEFDFIGHSTVPNELMSAVGPHELGRLKERASA